MGQATGSLEAVSHLIQLAVAPVFLLTAVSATLAVLANRLGRVVDRGRELEKRATHDPEPHRQALLRLERRAHLVYRAITMGVLAAILVSLLMACAFLGELLGFNAAKPVAVLFILALFSYTGALLLLLREVFWAIGGFKLGIPK